MLATRRSAALGERAGVIVDRTRPLVPVSDIPEDLIAQAQVIISTILVYFLAHFNFAFWLESILIVGLR